jgi:hypothetical protein
LPSLVVVLRGLRVTERRYLGFYADVFSSASISDLQESLYMTICIRLALDFSFPTIVAPVHLENEGFFVLLEPIQRVLVTRGDLEAVSGSENR